MNSLVANGKILNLETAKVMGIVNLTPDSFHRGSRVQSTSEAISLIQNMCQAGASIIDIGGQSSRPRAVRVTAQEELERIREPFLRIRKEFPDIILSIDTFHAQVAAEMIDLGVDMINDISAGSIDAEIIDVVGRSSVCYVLMHMLGTPLTMQEQPEYKEPVLDILNYLKEKKYELNAKGIQNMIIDPGFGFGKTIEQNYEILRKLNVFQILDLPILVGLSRKSMIYKVLETESDQALNGTSVLHMVALQNGAKILRAHDVKEAIETITLHAKVVGH